MGRRRVRHSRQLGALLRVEPGRGGGCVVLRARKAIGKGKKEEGEKVNSVCINSWT